MTNWAADRPAVGDRVRIADIVRDNVRDGVTPWRPLPEGGGTVVEVWTGEQLTPLGSTRPERVRVDWDRPGDVSPALAWRVGDLEEAATSPATKAAG